MTINKNAFTLIELLVVVLIIGILSAVALPQYQKAVEKSRLAEGILLINTLHKQMDLYILENGYPDSQVKFLGDTAIGTLPISIQTSHRNYNANYDGMVQTNYFRYNAYCGTKFCDVLADRTDPNGTMLYRLFTRKLTSGGLFRSCSPINKSDIGTKMCALLNKEGWSVGNSISM